MLNEFAFGDSSHMLAVMGGGLLLLVVVIAAWLQRRLQRKLAEVEQLRRDEEQAKKQLEALKIRLEQEIGNFSNKLQVLEADLKTTIAGEADARARAESLKESLAVAEQKTEAAETEKKQALAAQAAASQQVALMRQKLEEQEKRIKDWETQQEEAIRAAKAAILEAGGKMSSKLLEDHKREAEAAKKESEERTKQATEGLFTHFKEVTTHVASLKDQVVQSGQRVETVWRALSSPGGAGIHTEISLENTLKDFGLEEGRDFMMQYAVGSGAGSVRPDAVVFLPGDAVMVIDAKASKFLLDLAEAEGTEHEAEVREQLRKTMHQHLLKLAGKDYRGAVAKALKESGRQANLAHMLNVMYLQGDAVLEKVRDVYPKFMAYAAQQEIIPAGPASLAGLIAFARIRIDMEKQAANQEKILVGTQALLDSVVTVLSHAESVGRGVKSASEHFGKLSKSVNSRLLPRMRALAGLGMYPARKKELPKELTHYQVVALEHSPTIEGEAEEADAPVRALEVVE